MSKKRVSTKEALQLLREAEKAYENAYTPYSDFRVGAALICDDGTDVPSIVQGCNVENVSYGLSICAERVALVKAVSMGYRNFRAISIVANRKSPCFPCGTCLQFIREFGDNIAVILQGEDGQPVSIPVSQMLPYAFTAADLKRYDDL